MLSGNSLRNQEWIEEAQVELGDGFDEVFVQDYAHWHSGDDWIDLEHELTILKEAVAELDSPYGVFAKSIGTVLAMQAVQAGFLKPDFVMLLGIPLDYINQHYPQFKNVLETLDCPMGIIHNTHDKVGTSREVFDYLGEDLVDASRWHTPDANDHDYEDYKLLRSELEKLTQISLDS